MKSAPGSRSKSSLLSSICYIGLLSITVFAFRDIIWGNWTTVLLENDTCNLLFSYISSAARSLANGSLPLWSTELFAGQSILGYPQLGTMNPVNWLVWLVGYSNDALSFKTYDWSIAVHTIIAVWGMFYLIRAIGFNRTISFTIAALFCFNPAFLISTNWIHHYTALCYLPFILGFAVKACKQTDKRGYAYAAIGAVFYCLCILAAPGQVPIMTIFMVGCYGLYLMAVRKNVKEATSIFLRLLVIAVGGVALAAFTLLPVYEYMQNSYRFTTEGVVTGMGNFSYFEFIKHVISYNEISSLIIPTSHSYLYQGISAAVLCLSSYAILPRSKSTFNEGFSFYKVFFAVMLCQAIGVIIPAFMYVIPGINLVRELMLFSWYLPICSSILSAFVIEAIFSSVYDQESKNFLPQIFTAMTLTVLYGVLFLRNTQTSSRQFAYMAAPVVAIILIAIFIRKFDRFRVNIKTRQVILLMVCSCLVFIQIVSVQGVHYRSNPVDNSEQGTKAYFEDSEELALFLRDSTKEDYSRVFAQYDDNTPTPHGLSGIYGYRSTFNYSNPVPINALECYWRLPRERYSDLLNTKYILASCDIKECFNVMDISQYEYITSFENVKNSSFQVITANVYEKLNRPGYAYFVDQFLYYDAADQGQAWNYLCDSQYPFATYAIMPNTFAGSIAEDALQLEGSVSIAKTSSNAVSLTTTSNKEALLVISEFDYPGWKVKIDGKAASFVQTNLVLRGVIVPAGEHTIETYYFPNSLKYGLVVSCIAFMGIIGIFIYAVSRRKANKVAPV